MRKTTSCLALALCLSVCAPLSKAQTGLPCTVTVPATPASPLGSCIFLLDGIPSDAACGHFERLLAAATGFSGTVYDYVAAMNQACGVLVPTECEMTNIEGVFAPCNSTITQLVLGVAGTPGAPREGVLPPSPNPTPPARARAEPCCTDTAYGPANTPLYLLTTEDNAESECTAQGALLALYSPSSSPKAFYQSTYSTCSLAAKGSCAAYSAAAGLSPPLGTCAPAVQESNYAIASLYAADAPAPAPAAEAPVFAPSQSTG